MSTTYSDGDMVFGTQVLTIPSTGTATYIGENISIDKPSTVLVSKGTTGNANKKVIIEDPFTGSATLQIATSTTLMPSRGDVFGITSEGAASVVVSSTTAGAETIITCATAHGLLVGDFVQIAGVGTASPVPNGLRRVTVVTSSTIFKINLTTTGTGTAGTMIKNYGCQVTKVGSVSGQDTEAKFPIDFMEKLN